MNKLDPRRRKVVVLCAAVGGMSGGPVLLKGHQGLLAIWIAVMATGLVLAFVQLAKLKRESI